MYLSMEINKNNLVVQLKGELDHHSSEDTRRKIDQYYSDKNLNNIILDLSELSFMDSSGIGLIMGRYKKVLEKKGKIAIIGGNSLIDRILTMSGLLKIIDLYPTIDEALKKL